MGNYINWQCKKERSGTNLETEEVERSSIDGSDDKEGVEKWEKEEHSDTSANE